MPRINNIQVRRDTAANWTSTNPVLAAGEVGLETNTRRLKYGDGTTTWTSLAYSPVITESQISGTIAGSKVSGSITTATLPAGQLATTASDKSSDYTLVAADKNTYIRSTGSAITITVPDVLANGESVNFIQAGAEQITFAGSGVTINSVEGKLKTNKQFSGATITKVGGAYYLIGDLAL
jgi:hypothetical protein